MLRIPVRRAAFVAALLVSSGAKCGAPFQTDDPGIVLRGQVDVLAFYQSTLAADVRSGNAPGIELHVGVADRAEVDFAAALAFGTAPDAGTRRGYGDTTLGLKYVMVPETDAAPLVGFVPKITFATGNAGRGLGNGGTRVLVGVAAQKSIGSSVTYGDVAYAVNTGAGNRDFWFAGWEAQRQLSEHWILGAEVFASGASVVGQRASTGLNVGGYYVFGERDQALFSVGRGLSNVHETNRLSVYLGYQKSL
jgi:hypothetical protein